MNKETITKNFSRYAKFYDSYAGAQNIAAGKLIRQVKGNHLSDILELGCGTGNYTLILRDKFKQARIKAVDISEAMLLVAKQKLTGRDIEFLVSDAEAIDFTNKFDLITSNACFHWFGNLETALIRYKGLLHKGGIILFSYFGPETFYELNSSLGEFFNSAGLSAGGFISKGKLSCLLNSNFKNASLREFSYRENFPDLNFLLKKIKYSGIRGQGLNGKINFNRRVLKELEQVYLKKFKKVRATYQIFLCCGESASD